MKPKTRKGIVKRIKVSRGGDLKNGVLMVNRINDNHRLIRKSRVRKLRSKRSTKLSSSSNKLKQVM